MDQVEGHIVALELEAHQVEKGPRDRPSQMVDQQREELPDVAKFYLGDHAPQI